MQGANVSTNTLPNFWSVGGNGLTSQVVGLGVENGLNYIDINYNGVATFNSVQAQFDTNTSINAVIAQTWSLSVYMKIISSTLPPNSYRIQINEFSSAGSYLTGGQLVISPTTAIQRFSQTRTNTSATCAFVNSYYFFTLTVGNSYNFTIRIYAPQLEQGAYPTSYVPTTTSATTRNQDVISRSGISDLIGQTEGVMFIESSALFNDLTSRGISISDGTLSNRLVLRYNNSSNQLYVFGTVSGVVFSNAITYNLADETQFAKMAVRYRLNDISLWVNGVNRGAITSQVLPINLSRFGFDSGDGSAPLYAKAKQVQLYKTYLTDTEMTQLTTL